MHDAEAPADDQCTPNFRGLHLLRGCVGRNVEVLRSQAEQQVANRATDDVGLVASVDQRLHHLGCALVDQPWIDLVLALGDLGPLAERGSAIGLLGGLAQQLVEKLLDHVNRFRVRQPRSLATESSAGDGLVATGSVAFSSSGKSLSESL